MKRSRIPVKRKVAEKDDLMGLLKILTDKIERLENKTPRPRTTPFEDISAPVKIQTETYPLEKILSRKNTNIPYPEELWKKFITSAYHYKTNEKHLEMSSAPYMERACNQLIQKFKDCKKEELPILIINKAIGSSKKIAYYDSNDGSFTVKSDIQKKGNVELYSYLDRYLTQSLGLKWYEPTIKQMYREAPIDIKNKMQYSRGNDNIISFKHFYCLGGSKCGEHINCYRDVLFHDERSNMKVYKYLNRNLKNIDGGNYTLDDEGYEELVTDYIEYMINHEHFDIYEKYRAEEKDIYYSTEVQEKQQIILEQLYSTICSICNINSIIE
jgi:hypothetical protein